MNTMNEMILKRFIFTAVSSVVMITNATAETTQYSYDSQGRLSSITYADGATRNYLYENTSYPNALTGLKDESTNRYSTWGYDSQGRATSTSEAGGSGSHTLVYNSDGTVTVTDALGAVRTFTFGRYGDRNLVTGISGSQCPTCTESKTTTYDLVGFPSSRTDYNNNVTTYTYDDARGLEISRTEAFGTLRSRTISTQWHPTFRLPTQIDEPGRRTTYTHDASGNVLSKSVLDTATSASRTWIYTYNNYGQVLTVDGPRADVSDVTIYSYYNCATGSKCGQVATITDAQNHVTNFNTYNVHGQPLTITDPNGVVTTLQYDTRQRLISRTFGTETTAFAYWPTGLLKKVTLPDGSFLQYSYDAAHRLTNIIDGLGNQIVYTLDADGNHTREDAYDPSSVLSRTRGQVFDALSRLKKEVGAAGTVNVTTIFDYDDNGNQTAFNAPLGRNTALSYDELNRLKTETDPAGGVTTYGYNALDQLISVTDPRSVATTYTYNALGDLTKQVSKDSGTTTNTFDAAGNLIARTNTRTVVETYTYDALNRLTSEAFTQNGTTDQTITYSYDAGVNGVGRLSSASDASQSLSWGYDQQGRVTNKSQVIGGATLTNSYQFVNGQLTTLTMPSGTTVTYGYTNGRVTSISINGTLLISNVIYEPFGPARQWTWGNGTLAVRTFDQDGNVTQVDSAGLRTYSYDDAFRISQVTDADGPSSWLYGYDSQDRLTSASTSGTTLGWTYDQNGNRTSQAGADAATYNNSPTSNRLLSVTGTLSQTYTYDGSGNVKSDGTRNWTYNYRDRLKSFSSGSTTANYLYNALGQRVRKVSSSTLLFSYDEEGHFLGQYTSSGALLQEAVWLGDIPVGHLRPKTGGGLNIFYVHADHLNTPRKVTRPSDNKVRWSWDPTPFGTGAPNENPEGLGVFTYNLRFPGQYFDVESGLNYNYYRDYDPQTGRYVESDPIGLEGGLNTYGYVQQNPLLYVDPFGLVDLNPTKDVRDIFRRNGRRGQLNTCDMRILQSVLAGDPVELAVALGACTDLPVDDINKLQNLCEVQRTPIEKLLQGAGKIKDLRSDKNLKGVDIDTILRGTPRDLRNLGLSDKQLSPIRKALEQNRDLSGRKGGGR